MPAKNTNKIAKERQNVFVSFLSLLGVKHTRKFSNRYFNEHPHKYDLFGLSRMLTDYGITNKGVKTENKEKAIRELEAPFIAFAGGEFVVVFKITADKIYYLWQSKEVVNTLDEFLQSWSGVALLAEPGENAIEPDYRANLKKERIISLQKYGLLAATVLTASLLFIHHRIYESVGLMLSCLINLLGLFVTSLLVQKQLRIHREYADKICSLFKQRDCNNILESKVAKIGGIIGWSEIGLGYFISNCLIILLLPQLFPYLAMFNLLALPYTVWSVWYQKFRAKQWCPLCLAVQVLLVGIFLVNLSSGFIKAPEISLYNILLTGIIYVIPPLVINLLLPKFSEIRKIERITQEFNALKTSEDVFESFLKKQPRYEVDRSTSKILFGNPESEILITILTNPHCNPCARMHTRVEKLLRDTNYSVCVQYVFSSFNKELESSARFLMSVYFTYEPEKMRSIYKEWFEKGKYNREDFFRQYPIVQDEQTENEFSRHNEWKTKTQLRATPTILVNGYQLPGNYKIEDLKYFTSLNVNIK